MTGNRMTENRMTGNRMAKIKKRRGKTMTKQKTKKDGHHQNRGFIPAVRER